MERLARLLIIQNRNYPISMVCKSFNNRGPGYGDKAVVIRCAREDQTSITLKFYYLENGSSRLGFWIRGREFLLPVGIILKGGCLHGKFVDATPFSRSNSNKEDEDNSPVIDELGQMLIAYGFNYYGEEAMYSGMTGEVLQFKIFIGPVYYQRLRHMVSDKFQIRSTGTVDQITRQPIGGRKRGGGIRFGEMERDAVLAHGAAYLLHDWLHTCSDYHIAHSSRGHYCTTPEEKSPTCQISQELYMPSLQNRRRNGNCGDASRVHVFGIRTCSDEHKNEGSVE